MLIDLSQTGPVTIDPSAYPTTLAVAVTTRGRSDCGVFAGKEERFSPDETEKLVPSLDEDDEYGGQVFILDRPAILERGEAQEHLVRRWHYAAIGWDNGVYVEHPYVYGLTLEEVINVADDIVWSVTLLDPTFPRFHLILEDYVPGALARGVVG